METNRGSEGILSEGMSEKREEIVELLKTYRRSLPTPSSLRHASRNYTVSCLARWRSRRPRTNCSRPRTR
jgi:hypothetical protein